MTVKRAAAYLGAAILCAAWLASAAGVVMRSTSEPAQTPPAKTSGTETLAADVQAQALRLRERMASPPVPRDPIRNPFSFAAREQPKTRRSPGPAEAMPAVAPVPEPPLSLIGVAEQRTSTGSERTAIVTADSDEVFMLKEGDTLGARYRVKAIGADSLELTDLVTGAVRRLVLR